jgi:hypothetical protein
MTIKQKQHSFNYSSCKSDAAKSYFKTYTRIGLNYVHKTLEECFKELHDYRSISTGINHYERGIIYIDSDNSMSDESFLQSIKDNELPEPNYITTHLNNNHHQAIYWLLISIDYIKNRDMYLSVLHRFNEVGDFNAKGWRCDNCFYTGTDVKVTHLNDTKYTLSELYENYCNKETDKKIVNKQNIYVIENVPSNKRTKSKLIQDGSRHNMEMKYVYDFLRLIYKHTGSLPSEQETIDYVLSKKYEIADKVGKIAHDDNEIETVTRSCYKKGVETFNNKNKSAFFNDNDRSRAVTVNQIQMLDHIQTVISLKRQNKTQKQVSEIMKTHINTVKKYWKYTDTDFEILCKKLIDNLSKYKNSDNSTDKSFLFRYQQLLMNVRKIQHSFYVSQNKEDDIQNIYVIENVPSTVEQLETEEIQDKIFEDKLKRSKKD